MLSVFGAPGFSGHHGSPASLLHGADCGHQAAQRSVCALWQEAPSAVPATTFAGFCGVFWGIDHTSTTLQRAAFPRHTKVELRTLQEPP